MEAPSLLKQSRAVIRDLWLRKHGFNSITLKRLQSAFDIPSSLQEYLMFSDLDDETYDAVESIAKKFNVNEYVEGSLPEDKLSNKPLPRGWRSRLKRKQLVLI